MPINKSDISQLLIPNNIPLSLYIHMPWCVQKCPYCDFNSHALKTDIPEQLYINALLQDLDQYLPNTQSSLPKPESNLPTTANTKFSTPTPTQEKSTLKLSEKTQPYAMQIKRPLKSIFIGGGTPSLFSPESIKHLLNEISNKIPFAPDIEITMEANPGTVEQSRFEGFRAAGINRLSIGIQSFDDTHLKTLGRIHDSNEAAKAVTAAKAAGFDNINLDLMHGLPNQTVDQALDDIKQALDLEPNHISWYQLTIEPNTVFYRFKPELPEENVLLDIQSHGHELLTGNGFHQYEISAYGKKPTQKLSSRTRWPEPGGSSLSQNQKVVIRDPFAFSSHNINYWQFGDYLAIGAGAHGKLTTDKGIIRHWNRKHPKHYLDPEKPFVADTRILTPKELPLEFMMNALRLTGGVPIEYFSERTGIALETIMPQLQSLISKGLLEIHHDILKPTAYGQKFLNDVLCTFMN